MAKNKISLMERLQNSGSIKGANLLSESTFFNEKEVASTNVPIINVALGGKFNSGLSSGLLQICGPSKHFK